MDRRKIQRFRLRLPLSVTRAGRERVAIAGSIKNISSHGVFFTAGIEPDRGDPIEYMIMLPCDGPQAVTVRCVGRVTRVEPAPRAASMERRDHQIAATLERYEFARQPAGGTNPIG